MFILSNGNACDIHSSQIPEQDADKQSFPSLRLSFSPRERLEDSFIDNDVDVGGKAVVFDRTQSENL